jgi:hypothetical protein
MTPALRPDDSRTLEDDSRTLEDHSRSDLFAVSRRSVQPHAVVLVGSTTICRHSFLADSEGSEPVRGVSVPAQRRRRCRQRVVSPRTRVSIESGDVPRESRSPEVSLATPPCVLRADTPSRTTQIAAANSPSESTVEPTHATASALRDALTAMTSARPLAVHTHTDEGAEGQP